MSLGVEHDADDPQVGHGSFGTPAMRVPSLAPRGNKGRTTTSAGHLNCIDLAMRLEAANQAFEATAAVAAGMTDEQCIDAPMRTLQDVAANGIVELGPLRYSSGQ